MTNGSCHSRCESKVHTWLKPNSSAWRASSTTRHAGGLVWRTTPKSTAAPLPGPREAELDGAGGRVGPARRHDLGARVEVHTVGAIHVGVAEQRCLPAAEAVVGDRDGDGDVHAHHPAVGVELELAGGAAVAREDGGAVAVRVVVHQADGVVIALDPYHAEHRAE